MMTTFNEIQKFRNTWLWMLFAVGAVYLIINMLVSKGKFSSIPAPVHFTFLIGFAGTCIVFWLMRLHTQIDYIGIKINALLFSKRAWNWGEVKKAYVRQYKPLLEYGGWGIRYSFRNGWAYNVSGNMGLQLEFTDGKKILIGTRQPEELKKVLQYLKEHHHIESIETNQ